MPSPSSLRQNLRRIRQQTKPQSEGNGAAVQCQLWKKLAPYLSGSSFMQVCKTIRVSSQIKSKLWFSWLWGGSGPLEKNASWWVWYGVHFIAIEIRILRQASVKIWLNSPIWVSAVWLLQIISTALVVASHIKFLRNHDATSFLFCSQLFFRDATQIYL